MMPLTPSRWSGVEPGLGKGAVALGGGFKADGSVGYADAQGANSIAVGTGATARGSNSMAFGYEAIAADNSFAMGTNSHASVSDALAIGVDAKATGASALAMGRGAVASGNNTISIGTGNQVNGNNSGAIGDPSIIDGGNSYSVGNNNRISASTQNAFALGNNIYLGTDAAGTTNSDVSGAVAMGDQSQVLVLGGVALGQNSTARRTAADGSTPYQNANASVAATRATLGAVSIGNTDPTGTNHSYRQLTNVAAGTEDSDAVNVAQLKAVNALAGSGHVVRVEPGNGTATSNASSDCSPSTSTPCATTIGAGDTATYVAGSNMALAQAGNKVTLSVSATPRFDSIEVASAAGTGTTITPTGLSIAGGPSMTSMGIDAGSQVISRVAPGTAGDHAINLGQLQAVSTVAGTSIHVQANATGTGVVHGSINALVGVGGTAFFTAGDNMVLNQSGSAIAMAVSPTPSFQSVTAGSVSVAGGGPSLRSAGIDAGQAAIRNVADGQISATSIEAVNGRQLYATQQALQNLNNVTSAGYQLTTSATGTGVVQGSTVSNVGPATIVETVAGNNMVVTQTAPVWPMPSATTRSSKASPWATPQSTPTESPSKVAPASRKRVLTPTTLPSVTWQTAWPQEMP